MTSRIDFNVVDEYKSVKGHWALILGSSSGFGAEISRALAQNNFNIFGVHLDRRATLPAVEELVEELKGYGSRVHFFNINAGDSDAQAQTISSMKQAMSKAGDARIHVMVHSLAFGTLRPFVSGAPEMPGIEGLDPITRKQLDMTLHVMANTLVYWTQGLVAEELIQPAGRIFAMTSSGSEIVIPTYGAVSAAKSALEAHVRQLAFELAPRGIAVNALRAGVTDTPALRKIPVHNHILTEAERRNPSGRLTTPEDVARAVVALSAPGINWITGNIINVDGGEFISG